MAERRLKWLVGLVLLWGLVIFGKLISLQVIHHQYYADKARGHQQKVVQINAPRGGIVDRSGAPLALSLRTDSVTADPLKIADLDVASTILARVLHLDRAELSGRLHTAVENHRGFLWIKRDITQTESDDMRSVHLDGIELKSESQRHYPKGSLAAHVLGGVDFEEKGNAGVEKSLDDDLRGEVSKALFYTDVKHRAIDQALAAEVQSGSQITLSIDERLQFIAEREIANAVTAHSAASGSVVVMNPYDGQILALASYPTYDPNKPPTKDEPADARSNHATSVPFEPGSAFKIVTYSAAFETTKITPETMVDCHGGHLTLFKRTISDSHGGMGVVPALYAFAHSSNIGAIQVGLQVGRDNMSDYIHRFGFGQRTGIPLSGESKGKVTPLKRWQATSLASMAMGHEISVTTLQIAQAVSVIANGGMLVHPRLVLKVDGQVQAPAAPVRAIKPETSITMRRMMEEVVLTGTGQTARIPGYTAGGKTGTAQIYDYATKHYTHSYNGTFAGMVPLTNPAFVVVVTLNGTHGTSGFGGEAAAPAWKVIASEALRMFDVPKDLPDAPDPKKPAPATPVRVVADASEAETVGEPPSLDDRDDETPAAIPAPLPATPRPAGPTVPNFRGMSLRDVLMKASAQGLNVQPLGSGVARVQDPPPGAPLHQGERIRVTFAR